MFILPIPDYEEFRTWQRRSYVVWSLVVLNVVICLLTFQHPQLYFQQYAFVPAAPSAVKAGTSMFMHAGWLHAAGNMFFLVVFGRPVERVIGSAKFAVCYVATGLVAIALHAAMTPVPGVPIAGASGAVSGAVGMYMALFPRATVDLRVYLLHWNVRTWQSTGLVATCVWFVEQLALALINSATGLMPGIAFWAHVGGFVCGVVLGFFVSRFTWGYLSI